MKEGTDHTPHGIGIKVWWSGDIREGYWNYGRQHGRVRAIWNDGDCYSGEYKEGLYHGEGTLYYKDGDRYEGGWKDGNEYGQGTYYTTDGHKYTGRMGWITKGTEKLSTRTERSIRDTGIKIGVMKSLKRHGLGTLYSADGQVLNQGKWDMGRV